MSRVTWSRSPIIPVLLLERLLFSLARALPFRHDEEPIVAPLAARPWARVQNWMAVDTWCWLVGLRLALLPGRKYEEQSHVRGEIPETQHLRASLPLTHARAVARATGARRPTHHDMVSASHDMFYGRDAEVDGAH